MGQTERSTCDQCGEPKSIVSSREVCRDCAKRDGTLDRLQLDLYKATWAYIRMVPLTPPLRPVHAALLRLEEFYS